MGAWCNLYVLPKDPRFQPDRAGLDALVKFLAARLKPEQIQLNTLEPVSADGVAGELDKARASGSIETGCTIPISDEASVSLFGDADKDEECFWADGINLILTASPFPYADWESESLPCPHCGAGVSEPVMEVVNGDRDFSRTIACACGKPIALDQVSGIRTARLALKFWGNKGWFGEPRDAFRDASFLPGLAKVLGAELVLMGEWR